VLEEIKQEIAQLPTDVKTDGETPPPPPPTTVN
jgi:hypothetical protein